MRLLPAYLAYLMILTVSACATAPTEPAPTDAANNTPVATSETTIEPAAPAEQVIEYGNFASEDIERLVAAELALRRKQGHQALQLYWQVAQSSRDLAVAQQTFRLARYLNDKPRSLAAAKLWAELEPDALEPLALTTVLLIQNGQSNEALKLMKKVHDLGGDARYTMIAAGAINSDDATRAELLFDINQLLNDHPDHEELLIAKAMLLSRSNLKQDALATLAIVLAQSPNNISALSLDTKLRLSLSQNEAQQNAAVSKFQAQLEAAPDNKELRLRYARLLVSENLFVLARSQFEIMHQQQPFDQDISYSLALICFDLRDIDCAKHQLEQLLEQGQRRNEAHFYLGLIAAGAPDLDQAIYHLQLVQGGSNELNAKKRLVSLYMSQDQPDAALATSENLRQTLPAEAVSSYLMDAEIWRAKGSLPEAEIALTLGLELEPNNDDLLYARAMVFADLGQADRAIKDLRQILSAQPYHSEALNALGYILSDKGWELEEAAALILRALELNPNEPAILDSMGWVQFRLGNIDTAIDYLGRAFEAFPDPEVAAHYGEALWHKGEQTKAKQVWQQGLIQERTDNNRQRRPFVQDTLERLGIELDISTAEDAP